MTRTPGPFLPIFFPSNTHSLPICTRPGAAAKRLSLLCLQSRITVYSPRTTMLPARSAYQNPLPKGNPDLPAWTNLHRQRICISAYLRCFKGCLWTIDPRRGASLTTQSDKVVPISSGKERPCIVMDAPPHLSSRRNPKKGYFICLMATFESSGGQYERL